MMLNQKATKAFHFSRLGNKGLEFDPLAAQVAILDRTGRAIWTESQGEAPSPIRWMGIDSTGKSVETGDYICKIVYKDEKIAYLPFVFMKKD